VIKLKKFMEIENIIKGKISEILVEILLKSSGFKVHRLGPGAGVQEALDIEKIKEEDTSKKLLSIPDFIVLPPGDKSPFFVEVKFRRDPEALEEELLLERKFLEEFWEAKIIVVTPREKPYLRLLSPPYFKTEKKEGWPIPIFNWKKLEEEIPVSKEALKKIEKIIKKYFKKK
jgi:hypothetical protein